MVKRMTVCYVFHSETGHTRRLMDRIASAASGDKIEVKDLENYGRNYEIHPGAQASPSGSPGSH
jgi:flavodoxin